MPFDPSILADNPGASPPSQVTQSGFPGIDPTQSINLDAPQQPQQAPQQQPAMPTSGFGGKLKDMLQRFAYYGGQAALKHVGLPTDDELQTHNQDIAYKQSLMRYQDIQGKNLVQDNLQRQQEFGYLNGPMKLPFDMGDLKAGTEIRRREFEPLLRAWLQDQSRRDMTMLLEGGRNSRFAAGERGKTDRSKMINDRVNRGIFIPVTDQRGNITGFYNNRNPGQVVKPTIEGMRRAGLPSEEFATQGGMDYMLTQLDKMRGLAEQRPDALGPVSGRWGKFRADVIGGDPDAADLYQTVDDVNNQLVYLLSGKQINQDEFKRLRNAMPTKELPPETFAIRLNNFETRLKEILTRRQAGNPVFSGGGTPPPTQGKDMVYNPKTGRLE